MFLRSALIGAESRDLGIDADCIPTLDVVRPETHPFLMNRCYGRSPEVVARIGRAVADGLMEGGVLPVMKHMPGHGGCPTSTRITICQRWMHRMRN